MFIILQNFYARQLILGDLFSKNLNVKVILSAFKNVASLLKMLRSIQFNNLLGMKT